MSQRILRIRLLASKECIASAARKSPEARATQEAMQAAAIIHEIRRMNVLITADDREQLVEVAKTIGFSADNFMSIFNALADLKVKGKRRKGQTHHPQCINFFTMRRFLRPSRSSLRGSIGSAGSTCLSTTRSSSRR